MNAYLISSVSGVAYADEKDTSHVRRKVDAGLSASTVVRMSTTIQFLING